MDTRERGNPETRLVLREQKKGKRKVGGLKALGSPIKKLWAGS